MGLEPRTRHAFCPRLPKTITCNVPQICTTEGGSRRLYRETTQPSGRLLGPRRPAGRRVYPPPGDLLTSCRIHDAVSPFCRRPSRERHRRMPVQEADNAVTVSVSTPRSTCASFPARCARPARGTPTVGGVKADHAGMQRNTNRQSDDVSFAASNDQIERGNDRDAMQSARRSPRAFATPIRGIDTPHRG